MHSSKSIQFGQSKLQSTLIDHSSTIRVRDIAEETLNVSQILNETSVIHTSLVNDTNVPHDTEDALAVDSAGLVQSLRRGQLGALELCDRLAVLAERTLLALSRWRRVVPTYAALLHEANTWRLLHALCADAPPAQSAALACPETTLHALNPTLSHRALAERAMTEDAELRLLQLVVDWLEASAATQEAALGGSIGNIGGGGAPWPHTTHQLVLGEALFLPANTPSTRLVTALDPDAPHRQRKLLHPDDAALDDRLCRTVFKEIRCGRFERAVAECVSNGQAWRAAVLQGWRLVHHERAATASHTRQIGNARRDLWLRASARLAHSQADTAHFRAAVAVCAGDAQAALPVCRSSWEDTVWVLARAAVHARLAPALYGDADGDAPRSLHAVLDAAASLVEGDTPTPYRACQRLLMLGDTEALMRLVPDWLEAADDALVRFLAHLMLVLRAIGKEPSGEESSRALDRYVRLLVARDAEPESLALYAAQVDGERARSLWACALGAARSSTRRRALARCGRAFGVDVAGAVREHVESLVGRLVEERAHGAATGASAEATEAVARAAEWMDEVEAGGEALALGVAGVRALLACGEVAAAARLLSGLSKRAGQTPADAPDLRHYLSWKAYVEALEAFGAWQRHVASAPRETGGAVGTGEGLAARVALEAERDAARAARSRWETGSEVLRGECVRRLWRVLLFPGGWEGGAGGTGVAEALRLLSVALEGRAEAVQVALALAAEGRGLYRTVGPRGVREALAALARAGTDALRRGHDAFGFRVA